MRKLHLGAVVYTIWNIALLGGYAQIAYFMGFHWIHGTVIAIGIITYAVGMNIYYKAVLECRQAERKQ